MVTEIVTATIIAVTPISATVNHYEDVQVCTKTEDKTTEGALLGGLLGSQNGNALGGAILGGILGDLAGEEKCTTERRISHTTQEVKGYNIVIEVDGIKYAVGLEK